MSLIGFSGKINCGKDLAAEMVQFLNFKQLIPHDKMTFPIWETINRSEQERKSRTEIEKFGGKIKDIVCILLNCNRYDLENRTFKETPLGEEWDRYRVDSIYMPETMDSECSEYHQDYIYFATEEDAIEYGEEQTKQNTVPADKRSFGFSSEWSYEITKEKLTPRLLLQLIGTECGREILHPNIWVNATLADYAQIRRFEMMDTDKDKYPNWVISDVRFPNEVAGIENLGGIVIRINRDGDSEKIDEHESETALDNHKFEYVIDNNGTKEELFEEIKKIINKKFGKSNNKSYIRQNIL